MKVELGNCRIIKADDLNLAVEQYKLVPQSKNPKFRHDGNKHKWTHLGYYQNIHQALKKIIDSELLESNADDAVSLIEKIDELYSAIQDVEVPEGLSVN
jgi:hypothetical protein